MADGFRVDLGALESAAEGISTTLYNLHSKKIDTIDGASGDYGHEHLRETVSDSCDRWDLGVENLAKDGQEVANRLSKSAASFARGTAVDPGSRSDHHRDEMTDTPQSRRLDSRRTSDHEAWVAMKLNALAWHREAARKRS